MNAARSLLAGRVAFVCVAFACSSETPAPPPATSESPATAPPTERVVGPLKPEEAAALATMNQKLKQYVELHQTLERALPKLPDDATPEQIDRNQRLLGARVREARAGAKPGDIFTPEARPVIKRLLAAVFGGAEGRELRASINGREPGGDRAQGKRPVSRHGPHLHGAATGAPDPAQAEGGHGIPVIGDALILLDTHAHVVADFIADALPE